MSKSNIEWTGRVWNFIIGCLKKSAGCENCYAIKEAWIHSHHPNEKISSKFKGTVKKTEGGKLNWTGVVTYSETALLTPLKVKQPDLWFVNSLSDLFFEGVSVEIIASAFAVMWLTPQHTYQVLTKRPERMPELLNSEMFFVHLWAEVQRISGTEKTYEEVFSRMPLQNVWLGTSVEDQKQADIRKESLHAVSEMGYITWVSYEPALGPVNWKPFLEFINWIVAGGESGSKARPSHPDWFRSLRDQCKAANVPFFFKQWGEWLPSYDYGERMQELYNKNMPRKNSFADGMNMYRVGKKAAGSTLDGEEHKEYPKGFKIPI